MGIYKNLFISGTPGVGKTTLIREVTLPYVERVGGFYTEEMRKGSKRWSFKLHAFSGQEGILAAKGLASPHKLDKYGVDLEVMETIGVPAMETAMAEKDLIVIDEIGAMEMMSEKFRETLIKCLNGSKPVLATIRHHSQPFSEELKRMSETNTLHLTRVNFPEIKTGVQLWLKNVLK